MAGLRHLNGPRWVGHAVSPEGVEMGVLQECNWSGEPFTTRFVFRQPGGAWAAFYYDHQDDYWRKSRVWLDTNAGLAWFYRGAKPAVTFAWRTETCFLHRRNRTDREPTPMPANWSPPGAW